MTGVTFATYFNCLYPMDLSVNLNRIYCPWRQFQAEAVCKHSWGREPATAISASGKAHCCQLWEPDSGPHIL